MVRYIVVAVVILAIGFIFYLPSRSHHHEVPVKSIGEKPAAKDPFIMQDRNPHIARLLGEYQSFIKSQLRNHAAPGVAVAIIRDTSIIYLKGFGLRDVTLLDSVDIHTVFRIGSVSKSFASVLAGTLVDENKLAWNDPVLKYLPRFKLKTAEHTNGLTVRHVLSHTTGLPYHAFTDRVDDGANFDSLVYHLRDLDLLGKPGELYSYQNVGYSLISDVILSATGKTYAENLKEKIFVPLHMDNASVSYEAIMQNKNVALPHRFIKKWMSFPVSTTYYNVAPAGGINASIADMARWLKALTSVGPELLKESTRDEIFHPYVRATSRNHNFWRWKPVKSAYYAMGWRVINFKDDTLLYHGGFVNGYRSEVAINRKTRLAICVLVNSSGGLADLSIPKFFELYTLHEADILDWEKKNARAFAKK
jgi:beta-lactamase class C